MKTETISMADWAKRKLKLDKINNNAISIKEKESTEC